MSSAVAYPFGRHDGQCCPCPAHQIPPAGSQSAELETWSARLALYGDACKSNAFGTTVHAGEAVRVEGLSASTAAGADRIVWKWTDAQSHVHRVTNAFTVLSVRLFGDIDLDGDVDSDDKALHPSLTNDCGWGLPAATNVFRPVRLRTDVGLSGGVYTLSLSGDAGFRVWRDASGTNAPLLVCGQTVTNGAGGITFLTGADTDLYVEAVSNGTAKLTYGFTGTGDAAGLRCAAALGMTALLPMIEVLAEGAFATNGLQVAKWENAFSNGYVQAGSVTVTHAVFMQSEFIGADADRFRVRVTDSHRMNAESVEIVLRTEHPDDSAYDATPRSATLARVSPGVFLSTNLLLVSDWNDAVFDATAYGVAPDSTNRLFLSQLGSRFFTAYADGWGITNIAVTAVGVDVKTVGVDMAIMRTNGVACVDALAALAQVTLAKERFAQANVKVEMGSLVYFDAPLQVDVDQWHVAATNNTRMLSQEARSVIHEAVSSVTNGSGNICLIFVPSVRNAQADEVAGQATASYWFIYPADAPYADHCLISASRMAPFVSAHEMCHALSIQSHEMAKCNLMFPIASPFTDVDSSKRLYSEQVQTVRSGEHVK